MAVAALRKDIGCYSTFHLDWRVEYAVKGEVPEIFRWIVSVLKVDLVDHRWKWQAAAWGS